MPLRDELRAALKVAIKARDADAVAVLRSTLSAIDNAEAVPTEHASTAGGGTIAGVVEGLGAGEAERRELSEDDMVAIVRVEVAELLASAAQCSELGQPDRAGSLLAQAAVLRTYVDLA
jgi:uncharacterized protein YqeY